MSDVTYYKAKLIPQEEGLTVWFDVYKPIHQTEHFYFCVNALMFHQAKNVIRNEPDKNPVTAVKASGFIKVYRIDKISSRIGKPTPEAAVDELIMRTELRIGHLQRDLKFCKAFLQNSNKLSVSYESDKQLAMKVGNTKSLVHEYYQVW